jgi:hypothetical protein
MPGFIVLPLLVVLPLSAPLVAGKKAAPPAAAPAKISAPVVYEDLMLIVSTSDGVAAIAFGKEIEQGVTYRYRLLLKGAEKERSGEGKVFEKYERVPTQGPHGEVVAGLVDRGSELFLTAGPVKLEWSYSAKRRGWVYYQPEQVLVQIAKAGDFEKIDLQRFAR